MIAYLRTIVLRDFWLKLFSLGLAGLIWFTVNMMRGRNTPVPSLSLSPTERMTFSDLPVLVMSSAEDVRNFRVHPKTIEVTVQGERNALQALKAKDIHAMVDLTGIAAHDLRKRIEVSTPAGVTHVKVDPEEVQVIFPSKSEGP